MITMRNIGMATALLAQYVTARLDNKRYQNLLSVATIISHT